MAGLLARLTGSGIPQRTPVQVAGLVVQSNEQTARHYEGPQFFTSLQKRNRIPSNVVRQMITALGVDPIARGTAGAMANEQGGSLAGRTGRTVINPGAYFGRMNGYLDGQLTPISIPQTAGRTPYQSLTEQRSFPMTEGPIVAQNQALRALTRNGGS